MMKDFNDMTPAEIMDYLETANREAVNKKYDENREHARRFAAVQKDLLEDLMRDETLDKELAVAELKKSYKARIARCDSYFKRIELQKAYMESVDQINGVESKYKADYEAACKSCGRIESEIDSEKVASHDDCVEVVETPKKSNLESVALISVCSVIALVLILAIVGVIAIAR